MISTHSIPRFAAIFATTVFTTPALAEPDSVSIFAAGSLRGVVADLSSEASERLGVRVEATFGGSGLMRERIEKGENADLLMSADLGSPRKLEAQGRTTFPVIAFARNRMCIVSRRADGLTSKNFVDGLLAKDTRVKTSAPIADPSGDYAWLIFDRIDAIRPGAGARLKEKAQATMSITAEPTTPSQSAAAALFAAQRIDVSITYCSASAALVKELPELSNFEVPAALDPRPVYGIAIVSDRPAALRVVLFLLSEKGQAIIAKNGLIPLVDAVAPARP